MVVHQEVRNPVVETTQVLGLFLNKYCPELLIFLFRSISLDSRISKMGLQLIDRASQLRSLEANEPGFNIPSFCRRNPYRALLAGLRPGELRDQVV